MSSSSIFASGSLSAGKANPDRGIGFMHSTQVLQKTTFGVLNNYKKTQRPFVFILRIVLEFQLRKFKFGNENDNKKHKILRKHLKITMNKFEMYVFSLYMSIFVLL